MSGYTKGPWFTKREGFSTVYIEARIGGGMLQEVAACGPCEGGQTQQEANARLIAAAPELLEALMAMVSYAAAEGKGLRIADEAIAKANGQTFSQTVSTVLSDSCSKSSDLLELMSAT